MDTPSVFADLEELIGHKFAEQDLLERALTHRSHANEKSGAGTSTVDADNERLEFLGDAVLDLAMSDILMRRFPEDAEGALSKKRASLVNEDRLSRLALDLRLDTLIRLGKGEIKTGGLQKPRILASTFEAIMGAVFRDAGFSEALRVIEKLFDAPIVEIGMSTIDYSGDFKTRLQEKTQEMTRETPVYRVENETGPDHDKIFEISVRLGERVLATGSGRSKKAAEQEAARKALESLT